MWRGKVIYLPVTVHKSSEPDAREGELTNLNIAVTRVADLSELRKMLLQEEFDLALIYGNPRSLHTAQNRIGKGSITWAEVFELTREITVVVGLEFKDEETIRQYHCPDLTICREWLSALAIARRVALSLQEVVLC